MRRTWLVLAALLVSVAALSAKGPTVRLEVTGGTLTAPITITDEAVLSGSNVFGDAFHAGIASDKVINPSWPKYLVSFYVQLPAWMNEGIQKKYVVYYVKRPETGEGFVYLPAPGEEWYRLNVSTILRNGLEGNWLHASPAWAKALNAALP